MNRKIGQDSLACVPAKIENNLLFIYIFIAQELTNLFTKHFRFSTSCYTLRSWAGNVVCKPGFYGIIWYLGLKNIFFNTLPLTFNVLFVFSKNKCVKETKEAIYIT